MPKQLGQLEFPGMPIRRIERRASNTFAQQFFILMHCVAMGNLDSIIANRIMREPRRHLLVDFEAVRNWNTELQLFATSTGVSAN